MRILENIIVLLTAACQVGSTCVSAAVMRTARKLWLITCLLAIAFALLLGTLGLMIAALFIGLTPCLGAHWAAMIAAAASLAGWGIFATLAHLVSRSR